MPGNQILRSCLRRPKSSPFAATVEVGLRRLKDTFHDSMQTTRYAYSSSVRLQQEVAPPTAAAAASASSSSIATKELNLRTVPIFFVEADGTEKEVAATIGKHMLDVAHENNVELEGACGGELACSTCHLIFEQRIYDALPAKLDDEEDMLDLAFAVTETSRLGCQVRVTEDFAGMKVEIPDDGF